jgi:hypothetical protein
VVKQLPPEEQEHMRETWHSARVVAELGVPLDEWGDYVPFGQRCAPGLGWPLTRRDQAPDGQH